MGTVSQRRMRKGDPETKFYGRQGKNTQELICLTLQNKIQRGCPLNKEH